MRSPLNKKITEIQHSGIRRFFGLAAQMSDVVSLSVGEPDFETPWHIREAAIQSLRQGQTFYAPNAGLLELREGVAKFYQRKYGLSYDYRHEVLVTLGASEAIDLAFRIMLDEGDEVIVPEPTYVAYRPCIHMVGGVSKAIPLKEENQFKLTAEELEQAITPKTKVLLLCYPSNPTGAIMTKEDLAPIVELVKKYDLFVVSDEIYSELTYTEEPHVSIASFEGMKERTIVINGFSKAYSMTGWRLGYVLAPGLIIDEMIKIHQSTIVSPATFAQYAAAKGVNDSDEDIKRMKTAYRQRLRYLLSRYKALNLQCFTPEGAFYTFVNIKEYGLSSNEFCERLLKEEGLAIVPGSAFGPSGEGFVRISYAYALDELTEGMNRLERFLKKLKP